MVKGKALLIVLTLVVLGVGLGAYRYYRQQQISLAPEELVEIPAEEMKEPTDSVVKEEPSSEAEHLGAGVLLQKEDHWIMLFDEPGKPAANLVLKFNENSLCDFGEGEHVCDEKKFVQGINIMVEGQKEGNNLTVIRLNKTPEAQ